jgi:hypothetical protein
MVRWTASCILMYRVDSFDVLSTRDPSLEGASCPAARRAPRRRARRTRALRCSSSGAEGWRRAPVRAKRGAARAVALELALQRLGAVLGGGGAAVHRFHPLRLLGESRIRRLELLPQRVHLALHLRRPPLLALGERRLRLAQLALERSARLGARSAILARLGVARSVGRALRRRRLARVAQRLLRRRRAQPRVRRVGARAVGLRRRRLRRALGARDPPPQRRHRLRVLRLQLRPHDRRAVGRRSRRRRDAGERRRALRLDRRELRRRRLAAVARLPCVAVRGVEPRLELQ